MPLDSSLTTFTTASPVIASYNFSDIDQGVGIIEYYGIRQTISVPPATADVNTYSLQENSIVSSGNQTNLIMGVSTTISFDTGVFNLSRTVRGIANIIGQIKGINGTFRAFAKVQVWNGTAATDISSEIASQQLQSGEDEIVNFPIELTETVIKQGEQLRVVIRTEGGSTAGGFYIDPTGTLAEPFKVQIPFKIDL